MNGSRSENYCKSNRENSEHLILSDILQSFFCLRVDRDKNDEEGLRRTELQKVLRCWLDDPQISATCSKLYQGFDILRVP